MSLQTMMNKQPSAECSDIQLLLPPTPAAEGDRLKCSSRSEESQINPTSKSLWLFDFLNIFCKLLFILPT